MNPLTNVKNINKLNELELTKGLVDKKSWHDLYKDSAWVFIGGLAYGLTEGDILCVFSQYGEIVNVNLVRDKKTGKTKGFCFLCYANQKSTILAVDNLNGIKLCGRTIRVDHVANYKPPKDNEHDDEVTKLLKEEGCAPKPIKLERSPSPSENTSEKKRKKMKKEKKKHKKRKKKSKDSLDIKRKKIKKEKHDPGYDKYEFSHNSSGTSRPTKHKNNNQSESSNSESSSDDEFDLHASHARQSRLGSHDRKIQENSDLPGPSGYQESKKKHENKEKESTKKQKHKNPENYSDEEKSKQRKLQTCNLEKERHYNQPSSSFHNSAQQSFSQSFSDESSDKYSSSPKRRSESRHEVSHGHRSKSHPHKDKNSEDTFHKRNRHDSSSSMDNSPTRPVHSKSRDYSTNHSKHTKDLPEKVSHYKNNDTIHDRTSHRYTDEYKKHSSNSYNRERTESYDRTSYLNKSHHYNSKRNKER